MRAIISIIVPVYNGEKTLNRCLDSILSQTYRDFEVILVNDGSTDSSLEVCEAYVNKDKRIRCLSQSNKGVSAARNLGIRESKGTYLTFVDCDDWIEPVMLSKMKDLMDLNNVDIVYMNFIYEYGKSQYVGALCPSPLRKKDISSYPLAILLPEASFYYDHVIQDHDIIGAACGKLIKKSLLENSIWFNEKLSVAEDCLFYLECFVKAGDVYIDNTPVYHYVIDHNSANHKKRNNIVQQGEQFYNCYSEFSKKLDDANEDLFNNLVKYRCYYELITRGIDHISSNNSFRNKYKELLLCLQNPIYSYSSDIPKFVNIFKRVEIYSLKHRLCMLLLILNKIRTHLKPRIKHAR